jgi:hypothetical protein
MMYKRNFSSVSRNMVALQYHRVEQLKLKRSNIQVKELIFIQVIKNIKKENSNCLQKLHNNASTSIYYLSSSTDVSESKFHNIYGFGFVRLTKHDKKFWEELIAHFPLIRHESHINRRVQNLFYCCVCISLTL